MANEYHPNFVSPPSETLKELLTDKKMLPHDLARLMGDREILEVIVHNAPLTLKLAKELQEALGVSYRFWVKREEAYRESLSRKKRRHEPRQ